MQTFNRIRVAERGFTMIEVAISLGILAFALVAIVGVLPSGLKVQRENREETVVTQDALYLLEAIRSGSKGVDDLTNFVESITVTNFLAGRVMSAVTYTNNLYRPGPFLPLTNAQEIVSLLSTPKYEWLPNGSKRLNKVTMRMRSISGNAADQSTNALVQDFALRYQVTSEVMPFAREAVATNLPPALAIRLGGDALREANLYKNLYEVRLTIQWPLFLKGKSWTVGNYRRTVRTLVSGQLLPTYTNALTTWYMFQPDTFASTH
jgi:prepilin-type N-terminal cleavage/methylation domain-containing protein